MALCAKNIPLELLGGYLETQFLKNINFQSKMLMSYFLLMVTKRWKFALVSLSLF
jgi:hypothetical protein